MDTKSVTLTESELCIVLKICTSIVCHYSDSKRDEWEKNQLETAIQKMEREYFNKSSSFEPLDKWQKEISQLKDRIEVLERLVDDIDKRQSCCC